MTAPSTRVQVIAEAGVNHNGDVDTALKLIAAAAAAGADVVKFQTFRAASLATVTAPTARYQHAATSVTSQLKMLESLELDRRAHDRLIEACHDHQVRFLSTAFDLESLALLHELDLSEYKVPSGEITNLPYLRQIGRYGRPVILSTGMATLGEIESAVEILVDAGAARESITLLHCTSEYPAPEHEANLLAIPALGRAFGLRVGYSDHTAGIALATAAVALGAVVIEKHLTLDCTLPGPDHRASLEPDDFGRMVSSIRAVEGALGSGVKRPTIGEMLNREVARKSIVASRPIQPGEMLTEHNLTVKRPGTGLSPMEWDHVCGTRASRAFAADEQITR